MKSNQERQCRDCGFVMTYNGEKMCILDGLPLGKLFWTRGCIPTNFPHSSEFDALPEEKQVEIQELLDEYL